MTEEAFLAKQLKRKLKRIEFGKGRVTPAISRL